MLEVMDKEVALRDANQQFARYVRAVEPGRRVLTPEQQAARARALERMQRGIDLCERREPFDRDSLYER